jgi:hypothetical protein
VDFSGLEALFRQRFFKLMLRREKVRPETVERMRASTMSAISPMATSNDRSCVLLVSVSDFHAIQSRWTTTVIL